MKKSTFNKIIELAKENALLREEVIKLNNKLNDSKLKVKSEAKGKWVRAIRYHTNFNIGDKFLVNAEDKYYYCLSNDQGLFFGNKDNFEECN